MSKIVKSTTSECVFQELKSCITDSEDWMDIVLKITDLLSPYYDVDKVKTYSVYIYDKSSNWEKNIFDITDCGIAWYTSEQPFVEGSEPIIRGIESFLKWYNGEDIKMDDKVASENLTKITDWLIETGWKCNTFGNVTEFFSPDERFIARVYISNYTKSDICSPEFIVEVAMLCTFNRWADSGVMTQYSTDEEVIEFFKGEYKISAFEETLSLLRDEIGNDFKLSSKSDKLLDTMIASVDDWFNSVTDYSE